MKTDRYPVLRICLCLLFAIRATDARAQVCDPVPGHPCPCPWQCSSDNSSCTNSATGQKWTLLPGGTGEYCPPLGQGIDCFEGPKPTCPGSGGGITSGGSSGGGITSNGGSGGGGISSEGGSGSGITAGGSGGQGETGSTGAHSTIVSVGTSSGHTGIVAVGNSSSSSGITAEGDSAVSGGIHTEGGTGGSGIISGSGGTSLGSGSNSTTLGSGGGR